LAAARAVVIGAGIGGLAAAAGLRAAGWDVTVCERAAALEPVGAGLALAPNGLRALDALGIGDAVRAYAVPQELGIRSPDGRWLLVRRFGGWHEPIPSLLAGVTPRPCCATMSPSWPGRCRPFTAAASSCSATRLIR